MKKTLFVIIAVAALMTAACSESIIENPAELLAEQITVNVSMPETVAEIPGTKVSVTETEGEIWKAQWQKGDALGGFSSSSTTSFSRFTMSSFTDSEGKAASFSGPSNVTRLFYPYLSGTF